MRKSTARKKQTSNASAKVIDGKFILSLPDAQTPVVWQMDLSTTKASALEVRHDKEKKTYTLTLKTPKGETIDIASFKDKDSAIEGLMASSHALENAHGQIRAGTAAANDTPPPATQPKKGAGKKWLIAIMSVIGLFVIINIWAAIMPKPPSSINTASTTTAAQSASQSAGVPVSADDFLRGQ